MLQSRTDYNLNAQELERKFFADKLLYTARKSSLNIILGIIVRITRLINIYEFESQKHLAFYYAILQPTMWLLLAYYNHLRGIAAGVVILHSQKNQKYTTSSLEKLRSDECDSTDSSRHVCHFVGWFPCADSRRYHLSSRASSVFKPYVGY